MPNLDRSEPVQRPSIASRCFPLLILMAVMGMTVSYFLWMLSRGQFRPQPTPITHPQELKALETLALLAITSGQHYQTQGRYLTELAHAPNTPPYTWHIQPLEQQGLQIVARPQTPYRRTFMALLWGGIAQPSNRASMPSPQAATDDPWAAFALFALPAVGGSAGRLVKLNYCQSHNPTQRVPAPLALPKTEPMTYGDWPCPVGYTFAISIADRLSTLAARTAPSFVFQTPKP